MSGSGPPASSPVIKASAIPTVSDMLANRGQLKGRAAQLASASTLPDMLGLVSGTSLEASLLELARSTVAQFLQNGITTIEAQLTTMGVELDT